MPNPCDFIIGGKKLTKEQFFSHIKGMDSKELSNVLDGIPSFKQIPEAPFIADTNQWVKLATKYALRHAVEEGAQRVAWTTGEQQNERYDLSKQVDAINYHKLSDGYVLEGIRDGEGNSVYINDMNPIPENKLADFVGKDVAQKIVNDEGSIAENKGWKQLKGEQLKVGGKGMVGFYGQPSTGNVGIVGNVAKALVKELTGKEGKIVDTKIKADDRKVNERDFNNIEAANDFKKELESRGVKGLSVETNKKEDGTTQLRWVEKIPSTQHSIEITPELKAAVENGMPLFNQTQEADVKTQKMMSAIEKAMADNGGEGLTLEEIKERVAKVTGNNNLDQLAEDAYNKLSERTEIAKTDANGDPIKNEVTTTLAKRISKSLGKMFGSYTGEVFTVVKNSQAVIDAAGSDATIIGKNGKVLGAVVTDKNGVPRVFLNGEQLNGNTALHEAAGHIMMDWYEKNNPDIFEAGIKKVLGSVYLDRVLKSDFYKNEASKHVDEGSDGYNRYMQKEALAMAIGDAGGRFVLQSKRNSFRAWANKLWESVGKFFGLETKTPEQISKMSLEEFANHAAAHILDPNATFTSLVNSATAAPVVTNMNNRHRDTDELREEFGFDERDTNPQTENEWIEAAKKRLENGELDKLVKNISRGTQMIGPVEQWMLRMAIGDASKQARETMSDKDLSYLHKLIQISDSQAGSELARGLRARVGMFDDLDPLMQDIIIKKEVLRVDKLSEEQKKQVKATREKIDKAQKKYDGSMEGTRNDRIKQQRDKAAVAHVKRMNNLSKKVDTKIGDIQKRLADIAKKMAGVKYAVTGTPEFKIKKLNHESAKVVLEAVDMFSHNNPSAKSVAKQTLAAVSPYFESLSFDDVLDVMAGMYDRRPTLNNMKEDKENNLRKMKILRKVQDAESKMASAGRTSKLKLSRLVNNLKTEYETVSKRADEYGDFPDDVKGEKEEVFDRISEIENDINTGNYSENPIKVVIKLTKEQKEAKKGLIQAEMENKKTLLKDLTSSHSTGRKWRDAALSALNIPRQLMASADLSGLLRQGFIVVASHPIYAAKASKVMMQAAFSQYRYDEWFHDLGNSDDFEEMNKSNLALSDLDNPDFIKQEEAFMGNLANKLPLIKQSERAYVALLNQMRVDLYRMYAERMQARGVTAKNSPELYERMASYVNTVTGRGNLPKNIQGMAPVLNSVLFSPRLIAARVNFLTYIANPSFYRNMPREVIQDYFKDLLKTAAVGAVTLALLSMAYGGGDDDKDKPFVGSDPESAEWGKIVYDDTKWDIWGGFQQYLRAVYLTGLIGYKKATGEKENSFSSYGSVLAPLGRSLQYKLSPIFSTILDFGSGETAIGEKIKFRKDFFGGDKKEGEIGIDRYIRDKFTPMSLAESYDTYAEKGTQRAMLTLIPGILGVSTSTYKTKEKKETKKHKFRY